MVLRTATIEDLALLEHWDRQEHVIAADPDEDWEWEKELPRTPDWREQLIAELDGRPIGVVQIIDPHLEETHYWGEIAENLRAIDIWIGEAADLGQGYGTTLMELALARCFAPATVTAVLIDPLITNTAAIRFYKRLGFEVLENRVFYDVECTVMQLNRGTWADRQKDKQDGQT